MPENEPCKHLIINRDEGRNPELYVCFSCGQYFKVMSATDSNKSDDINVGETAKVNTDVPRLRSYNIHSPMFREEKR